MALIEPRQRDFAAARRRLDDVLGRAGEIRLARMVVAGVVACLALVAGVVVPLVVRSGSSASGLSPLPRGAPAPAPFPVGAVAPLSGTSWWVLGTSQACSDRALCVARTTDGAHFAVMAGPQAPFGGGSAASVARLTFAADGQHGYAWGPGLWVTANGGSSWVQVPGADVVSLAAGTAQAYLLVRACSTCGTSVDTVTVSGTTPQLSPLAPSPLARGAAPTAVAALGNDVWIAYGNGAIVDITAAPGSDLPARCPSPPAVQLAAVDATQLVALCPAGGGYQAYELTEAGGGERRALQLFGAGTAPMAAVTDDVCLGAPNGGLACSPGPSIVPEPPAQVTNVVAAAGGALFAVVSGSGSSSVERRLPGQSWVAAPVATKTAG